MPFFDEARVSRVRAYLRRAVASGDPHGAVAVLGEGTETAYREAFGLRAVEPAPEPMTTDTVFDLASITKVLVLWPLIGRLLDGGAARTDGTLPELFPGMPVHPGLQHATLRQVLTHQAGLPERTWARLYGTGLEAVARGFLRDAPEYAPGTDVRYASRGMILLGLLPERHAGKPLAALAEDWLRLAGIPDAYAGDVPPDALRRTAPTERRPVGADHGPHQGQILRGTVHDENAEWLGGFAGHAGAFGSAASLEAFCRLVARGGVNDRGERVLPEDWVKASLRLQTPPGMSRRGYVWNANDLPGTPGGILCDHLGFTGVGLWLEPLTMRWAMLLSNAGAHPVRRPPDRPFKAVRDAFKAVVFS